MFQIIIVTLILKIAAGEPIHIPLRFLSAVNQLTPQGRIVGGQNTNIEEHPWQVSLQAYGFHFCGGSIISDRVILTAGHCATYSIQLVQVRVGSSYMERGGCVHDIAEIVRHLNYRKNKFGIPENDIALLKLKIPIKLGKTTQPISLFTQNEIAGDGVSSTITGWGTLMEDGDVSDVLQVVTVPIVSKIECSKAYTSWGGVPSGQICAAYPTGGKDTCQGDSGGPLVIAGRQAGIVSWGNGCAREGYPGVYTEIAAFRDWIIEHANI